MECESRTLTSDLVKTNATEECLAYYTESINEYVWQQVNSLAGRQELLPSTIKRRKLSWFGPVCSHDTQLKIILQGTMEGSRRRGRPLEPWKDIIKEWTDKISPNGTKIGIGSHKFSEVRLTLKRFPVD